MLRGILGPMEKHHKVRISDAAIVAAVNLSHRYIPARQLPDKAVSLLDTAAARVAISQSATPAMIEDTTRRDRRAREPRKAALSATATRRSTSRNAIARHRRRNRGIEGEARRPRDRMGDRAEAGHEIRSLRDILNPPKEADGKWNKPPAAARRRIAPAARPGNRSDTDKDRASASNCATNSTLSGGARSRKSG